MFEPTLTDKADAAEIRSHLTDAAQQLIELRRVPADKRADTFARSMQIANLQVSQRGWSSFSYKLFDERKSPRLSALMYAYR